MKKSWHPLLLKNQERVWLEERKAVGHPSTKMSFSTFANPHSRSKRRRRQSSSAKSERRSGRSKSSNGCRKKKRGNDAWKN